MTFAGRTLELAGARGGQAHLWGSKHAPRWAWVHCNDFTGEDGTPRPTDFVDGVSVFVPRFGREIGPNTPIVGRFGGRDFSSVGPLRVSATRAASRSRRGRSRRGRRPEDRRRGRRRPRGPRRRHLPRPRRRPGLLLQQRGGRCGSRSTSAIAGTSAAGAWPRRCSRPARALRVRPARAGRRPRAPGAVTLAVDLPGATGPVHDPARRRLGGSVRKPQPRRADRGRARAGGGEPAPRRRVGRHPVRALRARAPGPRGRGAPPPTPRRRPGARSRTADGQATRAAGVAPFVLTADCLPVALAGGGAVAMLHCGWRGLAAGIVAEGVRALRELGGDGPVAAAIGPGDRAAAATRSATRCASASRPTATRSAAAATSTSRRSRGASCVAAGVDDGPRRRALHDAATPSCFFSHRRDGGVTGRQAGVVWRS